MGWHHVAPWPPAADAIAAPSPCLSRVSRSPLGVQHLPRGVLPSRTGAARLGACVCLPRFPQTVGATGYSTPRMLSAAPPPARLLWSWYAGGAPLALAGGPVALPSPPFFLGRRVLCQGPSATLQGRLPATLATRDLTRFTRVCGVWALSYLQAVDIKRLGAFASRANSPVGSWLLASHPTCATPQRA